MRTYYDVMMSQPFGFAHMLCALDLYSRKPKEIVVIGTRDDTNVAELVNRIHSVYLPNKSLQLAGPDQSLEKISPLLQGKTQLDGKPTVYVCHNFTCSAPATNWEELKPLLEH